MRNRKIFLALVAVCMLSTAGCRKQEPKPSPSEQTETVTPVPEETGEHEAITDELIRMVEEN